MAFDDSKLQQHPLSAAYPAMLPDDFNALAGDIKLHGLREPITVFEGQILDGWHRYNACLVESVPAEFVEFDEGDPREFVISKNLHRRHLSVQQRAQAAIKVAEWVQKGGNQHGGSALSADAQPPVSAKDIAEKAHVSVRSIEQAKTVERAGFGDLVRDGKVSAKQAVEIAKESPKVQAAAKAAIEKGEAPKLPEKPKAKELSDVEKLQIENEELREQIGEMARDLEVYLKVEEADGKTDSAIKDMMNQVRVITTQRDSLLRENAELKKEIKSLRRKLGLKA